MPVTRVWEKPKEEQIWDFTASKEHFYGCDGSP